MNPVIRIKINDEWIDIPVLKGADGKSAYRYAVEAGYEGTEEEFVAKLATKPIYTASEVGADPSGTAEGKVSEHNINTASHGDIRLLIQEFGDRLNGIADSDDTTLDQLSEIVEYIKSNKELIDSVTTSKVSVTDIVDNLTTPVSNKALSANQGVELQKAIDEHKKAMFDLIYPVGSIYMSTESTSPETLFGGTWQQIKDRFLLACGDTYPVLSTGGEATHTLTVNELPSHEHLIGASQSDEGMQLGPWTAIGVGSSGAEGGVYYTAPTENTGGGAAHNNMPPYYATYIWRRIA